MKKIGLVLAAVALLAVPLLWLVNSDAFWMKKQPLRIQGDGVVLDAVLALPRWKRAPFPAAVIIHGSAPQGKRDLWGYARMLVPKGLAVLLYDKRGVGASSGRHKQVEVSDSEILLGQLAGDALAAVDSLSRHAAVDGRRIGLIGASQAGWIMPLAASRSSRVAYIAGISAPAVTYGQEMYYSRLTGDDPGLDEELSPAEIERRFAAFQGPHGYDPGPALRALRIPSLWLLGERDRSVPTAASLKNLEPLAREQPGLFTVRVFPNHDHNLIDVASGSWVDAFRLILDWLREKNFLVRGAG